LTGVVSVVSSSLAILALLAFAVSLVAFLYRTSRHRSSRAWTVATGVFLELVCGGILDLPLPMPSPELQGRMMVRSPVSGALRAS
jgi:hypothetical protein